MKTILQYICSKFRRITDEIIFFLIYCILFLVTVARFNKAS